MRFLKDKRGASAVEYVILIAIIAVIIISAAKFFGGKLGDSMNAVANQISNTTAGP